MCSIADPFIVMLLVGIGICAGIVISALLIAARRYIERRTLATADLRRAVVRDIDNAAGG